MKSKAVSIIFLVFLMSGCQTLPPDMGRALALYHDGQINLARTELVRYIREKRHNPDVSTAAEYVLLIRKIKRLEAQMIDQWRLDEYTEASNTRSMIKLLHPVYLERGEIFTILNWPSPRQYLGERAAYMKESAGGAIPDSLHELLAPAMIAVLDRQQELVIFLAAEWEADRLWDDNMGPMPVARPIIANLAEAYARYTNISGNTDYYHIGTLASLMNLMIATAPSRHGPAEIDSELGWLAVKRELMSDILLVKSQLIATL